MKCRKEKSVQDESRHPIMRNLNAWAAKTHADYAIANPVHHLE